MKQYKIVVAYDGTDYSGWLQQKDRPSIVQTLQDTFKKVFGKTITLLGASKTDAGVHALGQVAIFKTDLAIDPQKIYWAWNNILPPTIHIRSLAHDEQFHPHYNVVSKTYYYHVFIKRPLPFVQRYGYFHKTFLDEQKLRAALDVFIGTHDFRAFSTDEPPEKDTVRKIDTIKIEYFKRFDAYRIAVTGEKFLRHMVRRIVGAALAVASRENMSVDLVKEVLASKDPNNVLPTAPAKGLLLYKIEYADQEL